MALTDNIKAYWKVDESSGDATDATGNGYTLTNEDGGGGSITYASGKINNCAENDGGASRLRNTSINGFNATSSNTWNIWVNSDVNGGYWIDYFGSNDGSNCKRLLLLGGGTSWTMWASGNTVVTSTTTTGTWYMLTITKNGSNWEFFLNGVSQGTTTTGTSSYTTYDTISFFNPADGYGSPCDGREDEIGYWTRVLNSTEITELYNSGAGLQYPFSSGFIPTIMMS